LNLQGHPAAAYLSDYALGQLELEPEVWVLAHLQTCTVCQAIVQTFEEVQGRALESAAPAPLAGDSLGRALALIAAEPENI
jgi:anti-sigma factor ChrR (cupin superfamily)